jgi:hypothetical protein
VFADGVACLNHHTVAIIFSRRQVFAGQIADSDTETDTYTRDRKKDLATKTQPAMVIRI